MANKRYYTEPADFIPKSLRKEYKLGEYDEELASKKKSSKTKAKTKSKAPAKKKSK